MNIEKVPFLMDYTNVSFSRNLKLEIGIITSNNFTNMTKIRCFNILFCDSKVATFFF